MGKRRTHAANWLSLRVTTGRRGVQRGAQRATAAKSRHGLLCPLVLRRKDFLPLLRGSFNWCRNDCANAFAQRSHIFFGKSFGLYGVVQINRNPRRPQHPVARAVMLRGSHQADRYDRNTRVARTISSDHYSKWLQCRDRERHLDLFRRHDSALGGKREDYDYTRDASNDIARRDRRWLVDTRRTGPDEKGRAPDSLGKRRTISH